MGEESQTAKGILTINGVEYSSLLDITTIAEDDDCINAPKLEDCRISANFKMPKYLRCESRKRFIKLLMGLRIQRNNAIRIANTFSGNDSWSFKWWWFRFVAFCDS